MSPAGSDFEVAGAEQLYSVSKQLKELGDKETRKALAKGIRESLKPLKADLKASALATLPTRGGLGPLVSRTKITNRTTVSQRNAGVRVTGTNTHEIRAMDRGRLRHPVFGNRSRWVNQQVRPGWWSTPVDAAMPKVRAAVAHAIEDAANKIGK